AASTFTRCDLTLETAQNLLGKIVRESDPEYSVDFIVRTVCGHFGIKESVLSSKSRAKDIASARQLSMYFSKQFTGLPYKTIGEKIGGRDHSTVLHACKAVAKAVETDPKFKETVLFLEEKIKEGEKN
ncbi:MAG: chromosomal replication initiator protein DnaA, partial [Bacteroidales bacterium]|nr:chromosomal replication initiator protein DnaA [Bacteroidales bacterium]